MEPHIFDCTLSFTLELGVIIRVVSVDGSINTTVPATSDLLGMFGNDEHKAKFEGYWEKKTKLVWLGSRIES